MFGITGDEDEHPARRSARNSVSVGFSHSNDVSLTHREVSWLLQSVS